MKHSVLNYFIGNKINIIYILVFTFLLQLISAVIALSKKKVDRNVKRNKNIIKNEKFNFNSKFDLIVTVIVIIFAFFILKKIIVFLMLPILIYVFFICPIFNIELNYKTEDSTVISSFTLMIFWRCLLVNISYLSSLFPNSLLFQVSIVFVFFLEVFFFLYWITLNVYSIFNNIEYLLSLKHKEVASLLLVNSNKLKNIGKIEKTKKENIIIHDILIIKKVINCILINWIMCPILLMIHYLFNIIKPIYSAKSNNVYYMLSKICVILSLMIVYIFMVLIKSFSKELISICELISFSIIIPIMIDLITKNKL